MTDPLTTQLPSTGTVPPTKRIKLDSVGDGTGESRLCSPPARELADMAVSRGGALAFLDPRVCLGPCFCPLDSGSDCFAAFWRVPEPDACPRKRVCHLYV